jgi:hypothetical protein
MIFTIKEYMDETSPTVIQSELENQQFPEIDMNENGFNIAFLVSDRNTDKPIDSKEVFRYLSFALMTADYGKTDPDEETVKNFVFGQPCTKELIDTQYKFVKRIPELLLKTYLNQVYKNLICFNMSKGNFRLRTGTLSENLNSVSRTKMMKIAVMPCNSHKYNCHPAEFLKNITVTTVFPRYSTNYSNKEEPFVAEPLVAASAEIDLNLTLSSKFGFSKTIVQDKRKYIFTSEKKEVKEFFEAEVISPMPGARDSSQTSCDMWADFLYVRCQAYFSYRILTTGRTKTVTRNYKGLFDSLSDFGGIKELLSVTIYYLHKIFVWLFSFCKCYRRRSKEELIADIFNDDKEMETIITAIGGTDNKNNLKNKLRQAAQDMIDEYMDIRFIVQELCKVRLLFELVMPNHEINAILSPTQVLSLREKDSPLGDSPLREVLPTLLHARRLRPNNQKNKNLRVQLINEDPDGHGQPGFLEADKFLTLKRTSFEPRHKPKKSCCSCFKRIWICNRTARVDNGPAYRSCSNSIRTLSFRTQG